MTGLSEDDNRALQEELERDYFECGCTAGKYGLLIGFVLGSAAIAIEWADGRLTMMLITAVIAAMMACALAGKAAGILRPACA